MTSELKTDALRAAAQLLRTARKSALATRDAASGAPYVSLVGLAVGNQARPLLLLSDLARHTRNLAAHGGASLLVETGGDAADALALARVTLMGEVRPVSEHERNEARTAYLASHPGAAGYADFGDFRFWAFETATAHFIGGFGRIIELAGPDLAAAYTRLGATG